MTEDKSECDELEGLSDVDLAHWQNGWNPEAKRHILAQKEWARRLAMHQLQEQFKLEEQVAKANRWWSIWAAVIGVVGTLAGAVIGAVLQAKLSPSTAQQAPMLQSAPTIQGSQPSATVPIPSASSAIQDLRASQAAPNR